MSWTARKVREIFLDFFKERGHTIVKSSPLFLRGDPTLLFTNAGMNQFKPYFLRDLDPPFKRAASIQKCMRAGGKHNDLDNVGFTRRHHTFFEMLGNFSFGDYFKREAILWSYELLTKYFGLDREKIWVSVYRDDDEAFIIWKEEVGIPQDRILRLGEKDNFWEMGETGPCGPSSEIHYDLGPEFDPQQKDPGEEGERFIELWNLVFMQFNRKPDGTLEPLPMKNIDTGMGLERLLAVLQGVDSNFHTDLFIPIIEEIERITGVKYERGEGGIPHRVIADHIRALTFAIADGIYPSNFGRGYVLRRILRRAHRFAQNIGVDEPLLYRLVPVVTHIMGEDYPELMDKKTEIELIIKSEEEKYLETIFSNLGRLKEALETAKIEGILKGDIIFKLYDTYGLPLDLIEDYANEQGIKIDMLGFEKAMEKQRERGRIGIVKVSDDIPWKILVENYEETQFVGYEKLETSAKIVKYRESRKGKFEVVLDITPFYAEAGGQIGDRGTIEGDGFLMEVEDTQRIGRDIVHIGKIKRGNVGKFSVVARVDGKRREGTQRAHTATHLLHASLREILGEHVRQEGSLVEPDRLRFDFTHFRQLTPSEIREIERLVNQKIRENIEVIIQWKPYREAIEEGVIALFIEKYEDRVRIVSMGDFSKELCGGTHSKRTGDIGFFKILKEESVARGIRRIEALTGRKAEEYIEEYEKKMDKIAQLLEVEREHILRRVEKLKFDNESLHSLVEKLISKLASSLAPSLIEEAKRINGTYVIVKSVEGLNVDGLRRLSDEIEVRIKEPYVMFLATSEKDKVFLISKVHPSLSKKVSAKNLISKAGKLLKGGGGGTDTKAEGGGKLPEKLKDAISSIKEEIEQNLHS
jgi:alanyl-tRNA synthetase